MMQNEPANNDVERLYTPWRMNYVRGERLDPGCVFCSMRDSSDDTGNLILTRGAHCYVVMNLFPYNTGHLLIVPNAHVASPEDLPVETLHELADQLPRSLAAARMALSPDGFNVGYNLGSDAGAGIAAHLHQHLVPRWRGDANFMPIVGGTKVLPELLPVTYAKLRAEFLRHEVESFKVVVIDRLRNRVLVDVNSGTLPTLIPEASMPIWKSALDIAANSGAHVRLVGVTEHSGSHQLILETESVEGDHDGARWLPLVDSGLDIPQL